jgi:RHS repeat-associated protein
VTRDFLYDGWNLVQEQNGSGAAFANSLFGPGLDEVFWRKPVVSSGSSYLTDALGSTVALTDGSGASTSAYTYEAYGRPTAGDLTNPFTFTGREWEPAIGLQLNRSRYYSPDGGRFINEDPIGESGGINLYQYAMSSPTVEVDPLGLEPGRGEGVERHEGCPYHYVCEMYLINIGGTWWLCTQDCDLLTGEPCGPPECNDVGSSLDKGTRIGIGTESGLDNRHGWEVGLLPRPGLDPVGFGEAAVLQCMS